MRERGQTLDTGWIGAGAEDDLDRRLADEEEPFDLRRPHVMTVLGPIDPGALGVALVDERLAGIPPEAVTDPDLRLDDPHAALAELEDFYAAGGRGMVDGATADRGRDAATLRWIAARAPVHVVAVAGRDPSPTDPVGRSADETAEELADEFARELTEGIDGGAVRAGAVAIGLSGGRLTPGEDSRLRAAASVRAANGAPVLIRAPGAATALDALAILAEEGMAASGATAGGFHGRPDESELRSLLEFGAFVAFDRLGDGGAWPVADQAALLRELVEAGHGDRLVLSAGLRRRSSLRSYGGGPGWVGTLERFPLLLMEAGLDARAVRRVLVDNPARALTIGTATEEG